MRRPSIGGGGGPRRPIGASSLRLTGGRDEYEGNVEVYHEGVWGGVCDDEWDKSEAEIVCRDLGYPGLVMPTHGGKFGHTPAIIWMDNLYCYGTEAGLHKCRQGELEGGRNCF